MTGDVRVGELGIEPRTSGLQGRRATSCASRPAADRSAVVLRDETPLVARRALARFWARAGRGDDLSCWWWLGSLTHNGYGQFSLGTRTVRAHRFAVRAARRPDPQDAPRARPGTRVVTARASATADADASADARASDANAGAMPLECAA